MIGWSSATTSAQTVCPQEAASAARDAVAGAKTASISTGAKRAARRERCMVISLALRSDELDASVARVEPELARVSAIGELLLIGPEQLHCREDQAEARLEDFALWVLRDLRLEHRQPLLRQKSHQTVDGG